MSENISQTDSEKPAGFFSRLIAFILDLILLTILGLIIGLVIFLVLRFFQYGQILDFIKSVFGVNDRIGQYLVLISPILFVLVMAYFVFFWTLVGYTPAKALLGLRIVRQDGRRVSAGRALVRYLGYWISAIPLFLGFIWILFDRQHEGWHDKIADTHVRYIHETPPQPKM